MGILENKFTMTVVIFSIGIALHAGTPKNIIIMISDGCGYNHIDATSIFQFGIAGSQIYEQFPVKYGMSTYAIHGHYDPDSAWSDFNYLKFKPTDSAAAATAMATGVKTYEGAIGIDHNKNPLENIIERLESWGKATGVVTTVPFCHATPAAFVVHHDDRENFSKVARDMILNSQLEVIMGAGHPYFDEAGQPITDGTFEFVGGEEVWTAVVNGIAGNDSDGDGTEDRWLFIEDRADFQKLGSDATPKRIIGVPKIAQTLQQERGGDKNADPFAVPFIETVPTLAEMTSAALNIVDDDPDGFFIIIEGGAIDWASENNQSGRMIEEEVDFNCAVEAVVNWVETNSNWNETLVIVTGDHESGYLTGLNSGIQYNGESVWNPIENHGIGVLPGMEWHSIEHTNSLIPFFSKGPGSELFHQYADEIDPARGKYLDNVEIAEVLFSMFEKVKVDIGLSSDTAGTANSIIKIPIYVREATQKRILGVELIVNTFPEVLRPLGAITEGTIASSWSIREVDVVGGNITIRMDGTLPLTGYGKQILVYIEYQVGSTLGTESPITITKAIFNEGHPLARVTNDGKFRTISQFNVAGKIYYYYNDQLVPKVLMSLTGNTVLNTYSDSLGNYQFNNLHNGNYVVKATKSNDVRCAISPYDALLVLRHSVGLISLTPYQMIAADVTGNKEVTSYDASYILRHCVGLISQFPIGKGWALIPRTFSINETNWSSASDSLEYKPLYADQIDQDFSGILYGDISGSWPGRDIRRSNAEVTFNIVTIHKTPEEKWLVSLEINFSELVYSGIFVIMYNQSNLRFVSSFNANETYEVLQATAVCREGINCAFASTQSVNSEGVKINLLFEELNHVTPSPADFNFANIRVDEKMVTIVAIKNQPELQIPGEWQLSQNYPNPFNNETLIDYQVTRISHIKIEIFNMMGQRLKMLVNENKIPGIYKISWDGKDDQGGLVGSGIYLYRMAAGDFTAVKKLVLVQ